jgi:four helix bundle protein
MFDFEKLKIYTHAKRFNSHVRIVLNQTKLDYSTRDQLSRASLSVVCNTAEGTGRFSKPDKRHFVVMAKSSAFECVAILDVLRDEKLISGKQYESLYA